MKTVIIGLGNSILSDDSVGIRAARLIGLRLNDSDVSTAEAPSGGIDLAETMEGYERAIIIDSMKTGLFPPGHIEAFGPTALGTTRNTYSTHQGSLETAVEAGRLLGMRLPSDITVFGIEVLDTETFSESLTPLIDGKLESIADEIIMRMEAASKWA